ncbi:MAG TPA: choice-of-anchor D domain-containing protein, partial [Candidatus Acidoferrales bacterium]|nr:choice-of-anchor D domain-containing protein [Candidatus Acidoferrales bacterium]
MKKILSFAIFILCISSPGIAQSKRSESQKVPTNPQEAAQTSTAPATSALARASYPSLPLTFEKNKGQSDNRVEFISRGAGYNLFLTADEAVLALWQKAEGEDCGLKGKGNSVCAPDGPSAPRQEAVLWLKMLGANSNVRVEGLDALPGKTNYFIGNDPKKWQTNVSNFAKVNYHDLYPGIDLTYYGNQQRIESDFVLAPGADPNQIQFEVQGASGLHLDAQGNLILGTDAGEVRLLRPGIYQMENGSRREVAGRYVLKSENRIGFEVAPYDTGKPLVIDPTLVHASYLGGSGLAGDLANAIAKDATGTYVTGQTTSVDFPGTVLFPAKEQLFFFIDTFVTKFNPAGNLLIFSDIIGGASFNSGDGGSGIGVDGTGSAYVVGTTGAPNFPTVNPFQATFGAPFESAYVLRLSSDGTMLVFSTFYGGRNSSDDNHGNGIFVEPVGNVYVVGDTTSPNFPTLNPLQGTLNGFQNAFVGEFNPSGQLLNSTYLGGSGLDVANAVAVDSTHRAYITGQTSSSDFPGVTGGFQSTLSGSQNAFVTRFNPASSAIEYSTYLRGTNDTSAGNGIVVDSSFDAYVTGQTTSNTFPLQGPAQSTFGGTGVMHAFITKFNPTGAGLVYSTLLGGESNDFATGIGIDGATPPNAYVTGVTQSTAFNLVNPMQAALAGTKNAFITRINGAGSAFDYSTYLGGIGTDQAEGIAVDPATGNASIAGVTNSPNFPVLGAFQSGLLNSTGNAFVAEISPTNPTTVTLFPSAFSFGTFGIGQTSFTEPVTLSNYSGATITVNTISLTGTNPGDFAQTSTCGTLPAALANGASCIIHVTFSPTAQDLRTAMVSVDDTGAGSPHTMSVSGIGSVPEISLNRTSINFGNSPLNYPTFNSVMITNTGGVPLHISSIQFSGTNASEFTTSSCIVTLAPGGACFVSISFIPVAAGARSASMLINSDAAGSPQILPLTGTGVAEVIVQPTAINFGSQIVGVATFAGDFTLINGSGVAITLGNPAATEGGANPGDFPITLANTTCQNLVVLQPGNTCLVEAKFLPVAAGPRAATISFAYTGFAGSPIVVNLTGNGLVGVSLANTNPNFGNQFVGFTTSGSDLLYNATSGAITVSSIVLGGTNPSDFTSTLNASCAPGGVVPANSSCPIDATFTPSALGPRSATGTVSYTGAPGSPLVANLTGTGIPGPILLSKSSLTYGGQITGTTSLPQRVILSNLSTADLHISTVSTGSAVFTLAATTNCISGGTVKAGASCVADVVFAPTATGAANATLVFTDDGPGSPRNVALSGVGEPPAITVSTSTLDFGNQTVGQTSAPRSVFLINGGASQITITTGGNLTGTNSTEFVISNKAATTCLTGAKVLGSGGTCAISITLAPASTGPKTATLTFVPSAGGTQVVNLIGTGVLTPQISLSPTFISFANPQPVGTTSAPQTVTLTNTGNAPLMLSNISVVGSNPGDFTTSGSTCTVGSPVPPAPGPGNTCTFNIAFAPALADVGFLSASLDITSNSMNNPNTLSTVSLSGQSIISGITVVPASFDYGSVAVGASSTAPNFTVTNNTNTPMVTGAITFAGADPGDFSFSFPQSCGTIAAFGGTCSIAFTEFGPAAVGARSGQMQIPYSGPTGFPNPLIVNLTGTGSTVVAFSPNPVTFPSTPLGGFTSPISAFLTNGTGSSVTVTNTPSVTGTNASDFSVGFSTCTTGFVISSGSSSCQVSINFNPTARGSRTAQLVYTLSAGGPVTLTLNGTATGPVMGLAPSPLNFPAQIVNTQSGSMFVTVSNTGDNVLTISKETLTGTNGDDFSFPSFISCFSVAPGSNCTIEIAFTPSAPGARTGLLTVTPTPPIAPQTVVLNGTGVAGTVAVSPTTLTYSSQQIGTTSGSQAVQLKNTSNGPVMLTAVGFSGANAAEYAIAAGTTCTVGAQIPALTGSCIANITFSPTATSNPRVAVLTISDNVFGAHPVNLSGTAVNLVVFPSPNPLNFPSQNVGTASSPTPITVNNFSPSVVTISGTAATITGTNASDFSFGTNTCTGAVLPASTGSCTINVIFQPASAGGVSRTANLTFAASDPNSPHVVVLNGTAAQPIVGFNSNSISFPNENTGVSSPQQSVTLTNNGNASLTISSVLLGGANPGSFVQVTPSVGTDCRTVGTVIAGSSCVVAATFTPAATGSLTATITLTDNATPTSQVINLSGTGTQPGVSLNPATIPFGNQRQNTTSAQSTSILTNNGTGPLTISNVALGGTNSADYALATPASGTDCRTVGTVAAGASCTIAATFTPSALGSRTASATITDDASPTTQVLNLTGTGVFPQVTPTPSPVAFGNQRENTTSATQVLTLTNGGTDTLHLTTVALGGANANQFAIAGGTTCTNGSTVAAGLTCIVNLTFTPTALGAQAATVTFTDDANPTSQVVNLTGTGVFPQATPTPSPLPFGNQRLNTASAAQTLTLTNGGTGTLDLTTVALGGTNAGDFAIAAGTTCTNGSTVLAGANCIVKLTFTPGALGSRTATVTFTDDANPTSQVVNLTGTGVFPQATPAPSPLAFGNQTNGTTSAPQTITLSNGGTGTLNLATVALGGTNPSAFAIA